MHEIADNSKGGDTDASQDDTIRDLMSARWERAPPRHARAAAAGSQDKPLSSEPLGMLLMHTAGSDGWKMDTLLWLNRVFLLRPMFVQIRENNKNVYSAYMTRPKYFNLYHLPPYSISDISGHHIGFAGSVHAHTPKDRTRQQQITARNSRLPHSGLVHTKTDIWIPQKKIPCSNRASDCDILMKIFRLFFKPSVLQQREILVFTIALTLIIGPRLRSNLIRIFKAAWRHEGRNLWDFLNENRRRTIEIKTDWKAPVAGSGFLSDPLGLASPILLVRREHARKLIKSHIQYAGTHFTGNELLLYLYQRNTNSLRFYFPFILIFCVMDKHTRWFARVNDAYTWQHTEDRQAWFHW